MATTRAPQSKGATGTTGSRAADTRPTDTTESRAPRREPVRAKTTGLYVAVLGILAFNISPFLAWFTTEGGQAETYSGYESDSLIPFIAYLGLGLAVALFYASSRAERKQHRGLSLVAMAVGLGAFLQTVATLMDVPGALERGSELVTQEGIWLALAGAGIWALGAGLLAKEPEGDPDYDDEGRGITAR